jgi:hypothetical protein
VIVLLEEGPKELVKEDDTGAPALPRDDCGGAADDVPLFCGEVGLAEGEGGAGGVPLVAADAVLPELEPDAGDPTVTLNVVGCADLYSRPCGVSPTAVTVRL